MLTKENLLAAWEQLQSDNALNRPGCSSKLSTLAITLKGHVVQHPQITHLALRLVLFLFLVHMF